MGVLAGQRVQIPWRLTPIGFPKPRKRSVGRSLSNRQSDSDPSATRDSSQAGVYTCNPTVTVRREKALVHSGRKTRTTPLTTFWSKTAQ